MRNRLFVPCFLFDFYTFMGIIGPLLMGAGQDLENFAQNRQCRFCVCFHIWSPVTEKVEYPEKQFSAFW